MSDYRFLKWQTFDDGRIVRISLNRPDQRNAQNRGMLVELDEAFGAAEADDTVRVIILAANGKHFSAGHDLSEKDGHATLRQHETVAPVCGFGCAGAEAQMAREEEIYLGFSDRWRNIPKPTIAAVNGTALGGGTELALASDLVVAGESAKFGLPEVKRGLIAAAGGVFRLVDQIPRKVALEMMFTGEPITSAEALKWGLINDVVPDGTELEPLSNSPSGSR